MNLNDCVTDRAAHRDVVRCTGFRGVRPAALLFAMALALAAVTATTAKAQTASPQAGKAAAPAQGKDDPHRREDIARHRQMARAHEEAARCLEAGEKESACQERLREACKGVGVGRYCGMRHSH